MPADESKSRLSESAYNSPYSRTGAPGPHPNVDPYALLRGRALSTLEAMGFDPETMVERGVLWAEDQDPFGHVTQSQYMHFIGTCFHRVMESYDEFLTEKEYDDMIKARSVIPAVRKYNLDIRRQVQYPDSLIVAYRQDRIEPTRNSGTTILFSLKQQAIVAEVKGSVTYMNAATGRPLDIRTLGGGWHKLYEGFTTKSHKAATLKAKWDNEHPKTRSSAQSKI
ncbi:hypothetical protein JX266_000369 [Neoarthrinium moseri]|uniref:uncharacterized protein n=1 Tax=Neoarthrinium moseri TaxID=1658444 RepID=UPI001FDBD9DA|nr:uncharacterized protein JN550_012242 [Neoarthrinium moseri]KAI1855504.1 hypothetical protein JX266_000369 [Neoarthrinium moseri]KAI1858980.1 hypothetical protein JN550_012242 [Neoarthrinium moseri]